MDRIRQKIKELRELLEDHNYYLDNSEQALGYSAALDDIEEFLDTLSEEPDKSLEEVAEEWAENEAYGKSDAEFEMAYKGFIAGAEWQKSQMLKDAYVESLIVEDGRIELGGDPLPCLNPIILLPYPQFKPGDKVRIIIVKED